MGFLELEELFLEEVVQGRMACAESTPKAAEMSRRLLEFRESSWNSLSWLSMSTQRALA